MYQRTRNPAQEPNPWRTVAQALETALMSPAMAACTCGVPRRERCAELPTAGARCPHCQIREAEDALATLLADTFITQRIHHYHFLLSETQVHRPGRRTPTISDDELRKRMWLAPYAFLRDVLRGAGTGRPSPDHILDRIEDAGYSWQPWTPSDALLHPRPRRRR